MAFDGTGNFEPLPPPDFPAVGGNLILASEFNNVINDLIAGLGQTITRNGQSPATANLPMGGFKHTAVADATSDDQYAAYGQVMAKRSVMGAVDWNTYTLPGAYQTVTASFSSPAVNYPPVSEAGVVIVALATDTTVVQLYIGGSRMYFRRRLSGTWTSWQGTAATAAKWETARTVTFATGDVTGSFSIDGSANVINVNLQVKDDSHHHVIDNVDGLQTALDSKFEYLGEMPGGVDLNTKTEAGWWAQSQNVDAASGSNYPTPNAGYLKVYSNSGGFIVVQQYHAYLGNGVWTREYYSGAWTAWKRQLSTTETYTKAEQDAALALKVDDTQFFHTKGISGNTWQKVTPEASPDAPPGTPDLEKYGVITPTAATTSYQNYTFTFEGAFPTACDFVMLCPNTSSAVTIDLQFWVYAKTRTGFTVRYKASSASSDVKFSFIARGY